MGWRDSRLMPASVTTRMMGLSQLNKFLPNCSQLLPMERAQRLTGRFCPPLALAHLTLNSWAGNRPLFSRALIKATSAGLSLRGGALG